MFARSSRSSSAAPFAALLLAIVTLAGCSSDPAGSGNTAGSAGGATNTATKPATNAPVTVPGGMPGNMPVPMGMEDSIEGRVVAVLCLEKDPNMPAAEAKACAESTSKGGGALAVLGSDGVLYINDETVDIRKNNKQLEFFIGEEVTVQGQLIGAATRPSIGKIEVKQFRMKLVRRKVIVNDKPGAGNKAAGK